MDSLIATSGASRVERRQGPHQSASTSPLAMFRNLVHARALLVQLVKRDVAGRYRGSLFGLVWSLINPLFMLLVYTFVFSVVFRMRWSDETSGGNVEFAVLLFVGMIVHGIFAESVNRAPALILGSPGFVKKVIFPLEIMPAVAMGSTLFHAGVSLLVLLVACLVAGITIPVTAPLLPIVIVPLVLLTLGLSWFLASVGVFVRDIGQVTSVATLALLFLSPVFYPITAMPEQYRFLLVLNPLTYFIDESRNVLIWGRGIQWMTWGCYAAASLLVAWLGFWWFQRSKKAFADVL